MSRPVPPARRSSDLETWQLHSDCGEVIDLDLGRYLGEATRGERRFLRSVAGPVIDVGCGPGRVAAYLRQLGTVAIGLDLSARLTDLARSNGAHCVRQSIFDPVPFEGRWHSVLLLDGNIGIGGDPAKMLGRLSQIVEPAGRAYIEVDAIGPTRQMTVREQHRGTVGACFPWAVISMTGIDELIVGSDWRCHTVHTIRERPAGLRRPRADNDDRLVVELERVT